MGKSSDIYNLDDAMAAVKEKQAMVEMAVKVETILELIKAHGIADDLEIESCMNYVKSKPQNRALLESLQKQENSIKQYQLNPQQHLKDLFSAKLNGMI